MAHAVIKTTTGDTTIKITMEANNPSAWQLDARTTTYIITHLHDALGHNTVGYKLYSSNKTRDSVHAFIWLSSVLTLPTKYSFYSNMPDLTTLIS